MPRFLAFTVLAAAISLPTLGADGTGRFAQALPRPERVQLFTTIGKTQTTRHGQATFESLYVELARSLSPRTETALVLAPHRIDQPKSWFGDDFGDGNEQVLAASASLLIRYRFGSGAFRPYVEAATGPMWAQKAVPASTSRFNFMTNFGGGAAVTMRNGITFFAGYRYSHISNGGYSPRNPGLNVSSLLVGARLGR